MRQVHVVLLGAVSILSVACAPLGRFETSERDIAQLSKKIDLLATKEQLEYIKSDVAVLNTSIDVFASKVDLDNLSKKVDTLAIELSGISSTVVDVVPQQQPKSIFGNQSGFNATVNFTNVATMSNANLKIRIVRISRSSVEKSLPTDYEKTEWVDISSKGSRRRVVVPCGFQVEAHTNQPSRIAVLIQYGKTPCSG